MTPAPSRPVSATIWRNTFIAGSRDVAAETPVAFSFNRIAHAVMMATPADLEDFAIGFSRSEGIIDQVDDVEELDIVAAAEGIECRMWVAPALLERLESRRRQLAGPTGCGLCGLESLAQAVRTPPAVGVGATIEADDVAAAMLALTAGQKLNAQTRAVHAAGFWRRDRGLVAVREDVGRHNALDKLAGALARADESATDGLAVMTSRISVELVQKAATAGVSILAAVSAPTGLALEVAHAAGMTLIGVARRDGFEVFTHPHRVRGAVDAGAASVQLAE